MDLCGSWLLMSFMSLFPIKWDICVPSKQLQHSTCLNKFGLVAVDLAAIDSDDIVAKSVAFCFIVSVPFDGNSTVDAVRHQNWYPTHSPYDIRQARSGRDNKYLAWNSLRIFLSLLCAFRNGEETQTKCALIFLLACAIIAYFVKKLLECWKRISVANHGEWRKNLPEENGKLK